MSEKKELNQEQLEKVNGGGSWGDEHAEYLPEGHGVHVAASEAYRCVGQDVYIVEDIATCCYCWGTLTASDGTNHYITAKGKSDYPSHGWHPTAVVENGKNYAFSCSAHTLYLYN